VIIPDQPLTVVKKIRKEHHTSVDSRALLHQLGDFYRHKITAYLSIIKDDGTTSSSRSISNAQQQYSIGPRFPRRGRFHAWNGLQWIDRDSNQSLRLTLCITARARESRESRSSKGSL
jgi:hypothetical protein